jgi:hypothetical protein
VGRETRPTEEDVLRSRILSDEPPTLQELRAARALRLHRERRGRRRRAAARTTTLLAVLGVAALVFSLDSGRAQSHRLVAATRHPVAAYPPVPWMSNAAAYIESRHGSNAFAIVDSRGHEYGLNMHRLYVSASTVKSMLLVAYLRLLAARHEPVNGSAASLLQPMIDVSDNYAAEAVFDIVGNAGVERVARLAHMHDFMLGVDWANEEISCADMARFFYRMQSLIPHQFRAYARGLLSNIVPSESWGIPEVARPQWRVYFKGGWRLTVEGQQLVSQIARLQRRGVRIAIAVMTVGDPSMAYGEDTIEGVTARLLGESVPPGA